MVSALMTRSRLQQTRCLVSAGIHTFIFGKAGLIRSKIMALGEHECLTEHVTPRGFFFV